MRGHPLSRVLTVHISEVDVQQSCTFGVAERTGDARDRLATVENIDRQSDRAFAAAIVIARHGALNGGLSAADCSVLVEHLWHGIHKDNLEDEHRQAADSSLAESQIGIRTLSGQIEQWRRRALPEGRRC